jgi:predicted nucleic acid-binding protein
LRCCADDDAHQKAQHLILLRRLDLVTTTWVLTEVADAIAAPSRRQLFAPFLKFLRSQPHITIVPPDDLLFDQAVRLYDKRAVKAWSLTDCISFIVMEDQSLHDALTSDHHFEQARFAALMK